MYQRITATLLAAFLFLSLGCTKQPKTSITAQQKATHLVFFLDKTATLCQVHGYRNWSCCYFTACIVLRTMSISTKLRFDFSTHIFEAVRCYYGRQRSYDDSLSETPFKNFADIDATP